jgi:hypothetical protein
LSRWWPGVRLLAAQRRGNRVAALEIERDGVALRVDLTLLVDGSDLGDLFTLVGAPSQARLGTPGNLAGTQCSQPAGPGESALLPEQPVQSPTWVVMGQLGEGPCPAGSPLPPPFTKALEAFGLERTLTLRPPARRPGDAQLAPARQ